MPSLLSPLCQTDVFIVPQAFMWLNLLPILALRCTRLWRSWGACRCFSLQIRQYNSLLNFLEWIKEYCEYWACARYCQVWKVYVRKHSENGKVESFAIKFDDSLERVGGKLKQKDPNLIFRTVTVQYRKGVDERRGKAKKIVGRWLCTAAIRIVYISPVLFWWSLKKKKKKITKAPAGKGSGVFCLYSRSILWFESGNRGWKRKGTGKRSVGLGKHPSLTLLRLRREYVADRVEIALAPLRTKVANLSALATRAMRACRHAESAGRDTLVRSRIVVVILRWCLSVQTARTVWSNSKREGRAPFHQNLKITKRRNMQNQPHNQRRNSHVKILAAPTSLRATIQVKDQNKVADGRDIRSKEQRRWI